jgi:hypothetical protein
VDFWRDVDKEELFKTKAGILRVARYGKPSRPILLWDSYLKELQDFRMKGMREVHVGLQDISTY